MVAKLGSPGKRDYQCNSKSIGLLRIRRPRSGPQIWNHWPPTHSKPLFIHLQNVIFNYKRLTLLPEIWDGHVFMWTMATNMIPISDISTNEREIFYKINSMYCILRLDFSFILSTKHLETTRCKMLPLLAQWLLKRASQTCDREKRPFTSLLLLWYCLGQWSLWGSCQKPPKDIYSLCPIR